MAGEGKAYEIIKFDNWQSHFPGHKISKNPVWNGANINICEYGPGKEEGQGRSWCTRKHHGYVLEGTKTLQFENGDTVDIHEGEAYTIDGTPHRAKNRTERTIRYIIIDVP